MVPQLARGSEPWPGVSARGVAGVPGLGGWLEADLVTEGFEFRDQAPGFSFGVHAAGEEVGAELVVGPACGHDVPDDDEDRVGDHDDRFFLGGGAAVAGPFADVPVVEGLELSLVADRGPG